MHIKIYKNKELKKMEKIISSLGRKGKGTKKVVKSTRTRK
jgi:hypothetical protein